MKITVVATGKEGISTTILGDQVVEGLKNEGHDVIEVRVDGRSGTGMNCKDLSRLPVICLVEHKMATIMQNLRYSRPTAIASVFTANVEGYDLPDMLAYMALFFKSECNGVPVRHVSHSHHTASMVTALGREYLRPAIQVGLEQNAKVRLYGIEACFTAGENDPDRLVAPMNRVVQRAKNIKLHSEVTTTYAILAGRRGFKPRTSFFHAPGFGPDDSGAGFTRDAYDFHAQPTDRAVYVANARSTGMFLSTSAFESFGLYYLELLASGAVGVFLDKPWVRALLPGYRFVAKPSDLAAMMLHVREDYAKSRDYVLAEIAPFIRETYSIPKFCRSLVDDLTQMGLSK